MRPQSCLRIAHKFITNQKNDNDFTVCLHNFIVKFFLNCCGFLVNFSYWSKFYVNVITGSGVVTIFYEELTRNPESWNISPKFCPISGDWGEIEIRNTTRMSLMKCYGMLQNARVTAFNVSKLLRENQRGGGGGVKLLSFRSNQIRRLYQSICWTQFVCCLL